MMRLIPSSFFLFIVILTLGSCKSNSTSNDTPPAVVYPNPGSYYIVQNTITDNLSHILSVDTSKESVLATNVSIYGKAGVTVMLDSGKGGWRTDTAYYVYQDDGDLLSYQSIPGIRFARKWVTYPCGSQVWFRWFKVDTTLKDPVNHNDTVAHYLFSANGDGAILFTIKGQTVGTEDAYLSDTIEDTTTGVKIGNDSIAPLLVHSTASAVYNFAPTLGYFAETDAPLDFSPGSKGEFIKSDVIDYVIK